MGRVGLTELKNIVTLWHWNGGLKTKQLLWLFSVPWPFPASESLQVCHHKASHRLFRSPRPRLEPRRNALECDSGTFWKPGGLSGTNGTRTYE